MAKKISKIVKLQVPAGKATPAPPVGPALGQAGVNIMAFVKDFNDRTAKQAGLIIPVEITVFEDRSFTFICKTPPAAVLLKKAAGLEKASGEPNKKKGRRCSPRAAQSGRGARSERSRFDHSGRSGRREAHSERSGRSVRSERSCGLFRGSLKSRGLRESRGELLLMVMEGYS